MKKIYSFIALFLMCFIGTANAQHQWNIVGENLEEGQLVPGEDQFYVLQEGDNTLVKESGEEPGPHSKSGFLSNASGCIAEITHECVFNFIETGEEKDGFPIYVLRNVANGKYLVNNDEYTGSKAKAFQFTLRKGVTVDGSSITDETTWDVYSNAVSATGSAHAEEIGAWVFCSPNSRTYMCFWGSVEPNMSGYIDTNNWLIKKVEEEEMSAHAKLYAVFAKYFANGVDETLYPIGINPGCVSEEFYNRFYSVYKEAETAAGDESTPDAECDRIRQDIIDIFAELETAVIPVGPGYFLIENERGGFVKDNNRGYADKKLTYPVESFNLENAKYIWKVENAEEEGRLLFKNFATNRYLGKGGSYDMGEEPNGSFTTPHIQGTTFLLHEGGSQVNIGHNGFMCNWNDQNDPGNHFRFYVVGAEVIDSLTAKVEQNAKNEKLSELVNRANSDIQSVRLKNGFVDNGFYNHPSDTGLVRGLIGGNDKNNRVGANATDPSEGSIDEMFDGKQNTYYHTSWHASVAPAGNHWVAVDLGEEVSDLIIKFTQRHNAHNGDPRLFKLLAPEGDNYEAEEWPIELYTTPDTIEYQYESATGDSTTYIGKIKLSQPSRYIRLVVTATTGNQFPAGEGSGPCWHVSELRFYNAADCVDNPNFLLIPEETRNALNAAIEKAKAELEAKTATDETYELLEDALEKFWDAYPDASALKNALESAKDMANGAEEGTGMGFFADGAKDALLQVVNKIDEDVKAIEATGAALTLVQIEGFEAQLDEAIAAFNAKLTKPEVGHVYQIVCKNGQNDEDEDRAQNEGMVASINADIEDTPVYRYKAADGEDTHFNTLWLVEKAENGIAFKNLANGLYMNNVYDGLTEEEIEDLELPNNKIGYSKTPKSFTLESFTAESLAGNGYFLVALKKGMYMNFESSSQTMVRWWDRNDVNSALTFQEVTTDEGFNTSYTVDVQPGKVQIVSLPINVSEVFCNSGAFQVLGLNGNQLHLVPLEGEVPAGTPFIVKTDADNEAEGTSAEKVIEVVLPNETLEDNLALTYNYSPVVKNGLVSAPVGFETEEGQGYGVLINGTVVASEGGDWVAAGTGFFNKTIPATEAEGDLILEVEGTITGEGTGTAVENVVIVKNVASDVYTVSGVKVRQNVKAGAATKGLPKGIYIVGGKKVVVK